MSDLAELVQQGQSNLLIFVPSAILLGALHGLEPGHSKTMMAAFIVAIRGTVKQAVLLGIAATLSHTAVVWLIALGGMTIFRGFKAQELEPYFQLASGLLIVLIAAWMIWRTWREARHAHDHHHEHEHEHGGDHGHGHHHHAHGGRDHDHARGAHAVVEPAPRMLQRVVELEDGGHQDAHERAHAADIERRFAGREITTAQIVMFGITGGLVPCPGAITVLLLCLQLRQIALGAVVVLCFSIGLALTLVTSGVVAAISVRQVSKRFRGFGELVRRAPYVSGGLIMAVGVYVAAQGWLALHHGG